ncbi:zinc carboxypeptidase-like [Mya arenaria]|uniref:zinc carboxypeptidase-like n=1 Tax=Mya arenaria TaxID=6604 RepID=UPI0022E9163C|nr:zinc carboxypeptidase-like [Mya arenaria]
MRYVVVLLLLAAGVFSKKKDFTGHRLVSVTARNKAELELLHGLETDASYEEIDFWSEPSLVRPTSIRVSPTDYGSIRTFLVKNHMQFEVKNENIQRSIDVEDEQLTRSSKATSCDISSAYCTYDQIRTYLLGLPAKYPGQVTVTSIGVTYEYREILAVTVSANLAVPKEKSVWVEAGSHSREWIAIASGLNLIEKLLTTTPGTEMLSEYDWNIVPLHNPDGYVQTHVADRFHRKNRQPRNGRCTIKPGGSMGIDLNRNWDIDWGRTGTDPSCSGTTYGGDGPFEAFETQALRNAVLHDKATRTVEAFFSVHAFSELLLLPYAYTSTKPADYARLKETGEVMMKYLETTRGTYYVIGTPPDILYAASGGSYDYFYVQGIPYSYCYELSPKTGGVESFIVNPAYIPDVSDELFRSLWAFAMYVNNKLSA